MQVDSVRDLGLFIRERRQDLRLSQAELAVRAGVGRPWLVAVERGHARAEIGKLLMLLAALGLTVDLSPGPQPEAPESVALDLDALLEAHDRRAGRTR